MRKTISCFLLIFSLYSNSSFAGKKKGNGTEYLKSVFAHAKVKASQILN